MVQVQGTKENETDEVADSMEVTFYWGKQRVNNCKWRQSL